MRSWLAPLLIAASLSFLPLQPAQAQAQTRAYAPEDLRTLSRRDQERVIRLEYSEQSAGRTIPGDQLRFYLDQVNQSNWTFSRIKQDIASSLAGTAPQPPIVGAAIRCESDRGRSRTCSTTWRGRSRVVRQLSDTRCIEGRNWTSSAGRVTVHSGCRAEFGPLAGTGPAREIRCESDHNRRRECAMGVHAGTARLARQLSSTRCIEGSNWGTYGNMLWVDHGCRGVFEVGGSGGGSGYSVSCASDGNRPRTCAWDARQGRPFLQQQLSSAPCREGSTWTYQGNAIRVTAGCRGVFGAR